MAGISLGPSTPTVAATLSPSAPTVAGNISPSSLTVVPWTSSASAAPTASAASAPASSGGGSISVGGYAVPTGPVAPTAAQLAEPLASLNSLDTILANKNAASQADYQKAIDGYTAQDALDSQAHDQNVQANETQLTTNDQRALLNAANAGSGLRGVLSSLGALGGSGIDAVRRLVGLAENSDTGAARQTFDTNANSIGSSWAQALHDEQQRRDDASALLQNNLQNNKADVLNSRKTILQQLASLWGANTSQGDSYASQAAALAAPIAATTKATVASYSPVSSLYTPAALQQYLAGTQNLNVNTSPTDGNTSTPINAPGYSGAGAKKDTLPGVA